MSASLQQLLAGSCAHVEPAAMHAEKFLSALFSHLFHTSSRLVSNWSQTFCTPFFTPFAVLVGHHLHTLYPTPL